MTTNAWIWIYVGTALLILEVIVPGFVLCFFGLAALSVGALRFVFGEAFDLAWELAAFSAFSVAYIVLLRRWFKRALVGDKQNDADLKDDNLGRVGKVTSAIEPPLSGRVMLGDAEWTAAADQPIEKGANVKVVAQQNLTMKVEEV